MRTRFVDAAQHADAFFVIRAISTVGCSRGGVVTKIGANFDWQFQLPMEVGVLTTANFVGSWHCPIEIGVLATANFVGSWHWQLSIGSWQLCIGSWQLSIGSERLATTIKKVAIVKTNNWMAVLLTGDPANWQYELSNDILFAFEKVL